MPNTLKPLCQEDIGDFFYLTIKKIGGFYRQKNLLSNNIFS
jgi:hypothetical protein